MSGSLPCCAIPSWTTRTRCRDRTRRIPRPTGPYYETRFPYLSQGDVFDDVPFGVLGPELVYDPERPGGVLHPIVASRGMIVSPTCDFRRPTSSALATDPSIVPYTLQGHVVVAPVLPLDEIAALWGDRRASNLHLLRQFDAMRRYMYLPPVAREDGTQEWLVDLTRLDAVAIGFLVEMLPSRRAQLTFAAAQQLQFKVVMAATSRFTDRSAYEPSME